MSISNPVTIFDQNSQHTSSGSATANSTTADAPIGSAIFVLIHPTITDSILNLSDSSGNNYSPGVQFYPASTEGLEIWHCLNSPNDLPIGSVFTAVTSGGNTFVLVGAVYSTGVNGGLDQTNTVLTGSSATTFSLTTGNLSGSELVLGATFGTTAYSTYVEDAAFTEMILSPVTNTYGMDFAYDIVNTTGGITWAPSWTPALTAIGIIATYKATPSATTTLNQQSLIFM